MTSGLGPAAPSIPRRGTAVGRGREVRLHRNLDSSDSARTKRVRNYSLLAPAEPAGDPAATEIQELGYSHKFTIGIGDQYHKVKYTGD